MVWLIALVLAPVAVGMMLSPGGRLLLVMAAALVVFTPGVASFTPKFVFVALMLVSSAVSLLRLRGSGLRPGGGLLLAVACYGAALTVSALLRWTVDPIGTLQNGLPFIMPLLILPVALDAGVSSNRRLLENGTLLVGLISAASFTVSWLSRRGVSTLDISSLFANSVAMPALVFQWALVTTAQPSRGRPVRVFAAAVGLIIPFAFLITGSRSALILALGFGTFLVSRVAQRKAFRTTFGIVVTTAISVPIILWLASQLVSQEDFISRRLRALQLALSYGSLGDQSWGERMRAASAAQRALTESWLFGRGLSMPNPVNPFDTPLSSVMRIGIVGTFFLIVYIIVALRWAMNTAPRNPTGDDLRGIMTGWLMTMVGYGLLVSPLEDPLFAFAFATPIALAVNARHKGEQTKPEAVELRNKPSSAASSRTVRRGTFRQRHYAGRIERTNPSESGARNRAHEGRIGT